MFAPACICVIELPESSSVTAGGDTVTGSTLQPTETTTLLANEDEAFALEPLDTTSVVGGTIQ